VGALQTALRWLRETEVRGADPTLPWGSSYIPTNGQLGMVAAGVPINDDMALSIATVFTCVAILADSVSTLQLKAYRRSAAGAEKALDPAPMLVANPWPEGILQDWLTQVMVSLTLRGNFYGRIVERDARGFATSIQPLHPDIVVPRRNADTGAREYWIQGRPVSSHDMLHIPALLVPGSFVGLNPVEYQRTSWGLAAATEKYGGQFFANSAHPSGVIEYPGDLSPEETLEMARDWKMAHSGIGNAQFPAILTGGAEWKSVSLGPDDAQFLGTRSFQRSEIGSFFRIPEHMLGIQDKTSSWGTGIEQMEIGFVTNTLRPWLTRIETYMSNLLPPNQIAKFDLTSRMRGDSGQRSAYYTAMINAGLMCADTACDLEGLPRLPNGEGQIYYRPTNFTTTTQMKDNPPAPGSSGGIGGGIDQAPDAPAPGGPQSGPGNDSQKDAA
jgi:HK97 family phage portal protein